MDKQDQKSVQEQQVNSQGFRPKLIRPFPKRSVSAGALSDLIGSISDLDVSNQKSSPTKRIFSFNDKFNEGLSDSDSVEALNNEENSHNEANPVVKRSMGFRVIERSARPSVLTVQETSSFTSELESALDDRSPSPVIQRSSEGVSFNATALQGEIGQDLSRPSSAASDRSQ